MKFGVMLELLWLVSYVEVGVAVVADDDDDVGVVVDDDVVVVVVVPLFVTSHHYSHCVHLPSIQLPTSPLHLANNIKSTTTTTPVTTTSTTIPIHIYSDISTSTLHINPHDSSSESSFDGDNCAPFGRSPIPFLASTPLPTNITQNNPHPLPKLNV